MTPREFLQKVVELNIEEARGGQDIRTIYNAVASVDALAAHIFVWCKHNAPQEVSAWQRDDGYRASSGARHASVGYLHDIAKAQKHVTLTQGSPVVTRADEVKPMRFGFGEGAFGIGPYGGGEQIAVLIDGTKMQLLPILWAARDFYIAEMDRLGIS